MAGVMNKILQIRNIALVFVLAPQLAWAQVAITEIMYDPAGVDSGHEWIEVYNEGTSSIPLSSWKIFEGDANHNIVAASSDSLFAPDTYAVIAQNAIKFQTDYPNFAGELFHSAFALDNGGATLTLRDKSLTDIDAVTYDSSWGGLGDGNSLQRSPGDQGNFVPRTPTPGGPIAAAMVAPKLKPTVPGNTAKPKQSTSLKTTSVSASTANVRSTNDAGNMAVVTSQTAAVAMPGIDSYWFFALAAVILLAVAAIAGAQHFKKSEWDIIEESPEDV